MKVESDFHSKTKPDGSIYLYPNCKECRRNQMREHYRNNKPSYAVSRKAVRAKIIEFVTECKSAPCSDCKVSYPPYVMDMDHRDGSAKEFNVSDLVKQGSLRLVKAEVAKCDVVCANCHRERTHQRRITSP